MAKTKKWKDLVAKMDPERQARNKAATAVLLAEMPLQELRRARELSQQQLAETLGEKQPSVSKLERQADMYVSTLRRYIEAMGGSLDILARFPDGEVRVTQFHTIEIKEVVDAAAEHRSEGRQLAN